MSSAPPPGWYPDSGSGERWWDGRGWTAHTRQAPTIVDESPGSALMAQADSGSGVTRRAAGWYEEPGRPGMIRYWSGTAWQGDARLAPGRLLDHFDGLHLYENEVWRGAPGTTGAVGGSLVGAEAQVGTEGQITQRITATRLVALGVFALAVPKRSGNQIVMLHVKSPAYELVHAVQSRGSTREWSRLARIAEYINNRRIALSKLEERPVTPAGSLGGGPSIADELRKLASLRDEGLLTDEEFAEQKATLLRRRP